ncbi:hypothetical protein ACP6L2_00325 [Sphingobacterium lactis]|uniref:hypothetical protein n=1 Tax=Sphingobacterium lactis TaxID=797291 RepID=UPI003F7D4BB0
MKKLIQGIFIFSALSICFLSCKKGEYINNSIRFTTISFEQIQSVQIPYLEVNNVRYYQKNGYLMPYIDADSIEISGEYDNGRKHFKQKIVNKYGSNRLYVYYKNMVDSTLQIGGPHPLGDVEPPEGMIGLKFFGANKQISPDGKPIHLVIYDVEGEIQNEIEPKYTVIDTIRNITNDIPLNFVNVKLPKKNWRFKVLNEDKTEAKINGRILFDFQTSAYKKVRIFKLSDGFRLPPPFANRDLNSRFQYKTNAYAISLIQPYLDR